jgi:cell shape-determining protein MreC
MNYLQKSSNFENRRREAKNKIFIITVCLIAVILILSIGTVRRSLFTVATPVWKFKNSIMNSNFFEFFKTKKTLINERLAMEQRLFLAGNLLTTNDSLLRENEVLKDLLGRKEIKDKTILASILVKPPQTPYDSLIVDIGSDFEVKVGDKVIANANVYVGEVSEVYPRSSKIILYSSPGHKLSVVLGINSVTVEAIGLGGGNFSINLPREIEVKENDVITVPSIMSNVFGIVENINYKDTDSFQNVMFKSPVNISELSFIEIVL